MRGVLRRKPGPRTTAAMAAKQRGVLRRGDNHILRDENNLPIHGYHPPTLGQRFELFSLELQLGVRVGPPANNVVAADLIRRMSRRI